VPAHKKNEGEEELNYYYYSTLGAEVSLKRLASVAKSRWTIEQFYEDGKGECGLSDYQGRRWEGLHRHLALSMLAYSFLMPHRSKSWKAPSS
jgi:SRSO17 transposase